MKLWKPFRSATTLFNTDRAIKKQVKRNKSTIYGGQAIRRHIGFLARPTQDYDIFSDAPNKSARQLEKNLDRKSGGNYYYTQPAMHEGTHKVKHVGPDSKPMTKDDIHIADFTKPDRKIRTVKRDGIKYVHISEVIKDKKKALRDKEFAFRHEKDRDDLRRIQMARQYKLLNSRRKR